MRLPCPFLKFPFRFDAERLRAEAEAIPEQDWIRHPQDYRGNSALPLISTNGTLNDELEPPMRPTEHLKRSPYIRQVLGQFQTLLGRARFMRLEPGCGVPPHVDIQYYWRTHTRVHIPVVTHPDIRFRCGDAEVHMAAGEAWTFDNWRAHEVVNETPVRRIHLVFDTYGTSAFWALARPHDGGEPERAVPYREGAEPSLAFENYVAPPVMPPGDLDMEMTQLVEDVAANPENDHAAVKLFEDFTVNLRNEWRVVWHLAGPEGAGLKKFDELLAKARGAAEKLPETLRVASNGMSAVRILGSDFAAMIRPSALGRERSMGPSEPRTPVVEMPKRAAAASGAVPEFDRPVFIVSAPRSGSTWLFELLCENENFWTVGGEAHNHIEGIPALHPKNRDFDSNRLTAADATPEICEKLHGHFAATLCDADRRLYRDMTGARPASIRFLEKTPRNALRIPFFRAAYPGAKFVFLHRRPEENMSSIIEAWRSGRFATYRDLPGWTGLPWSLLLIPGWRDLNGRPLGEIAMRQWRDTNQIIMADLVTLPREDWCAVSYEEIRADPVAAVERLCAFAGVPVTRRQRRRAEDPSRQSRYTLTAPDAQKWRKNEAEIVPYLGRLGAMVERLKRLSVQEVRASERVH